MAFQSQSDDDLQSKFNGGVLQILRIHNLQDIINKANVNLKLFNSEFGVYNYELKFRCLCSLYNEVRPKCSKDDKESEQKTTDTMMNGLKLFIRKYPIHQQTKNILNEKKIIINDNIWFIFEDKLNDFETKVRDLLEGHSMNSPNYDYDADEI